MKEIGFFVFIIDFGEAFGKKYLPVRNVFSFKLKS